MNLYQGGSKFSAPLFSSVLHDAASNNIELPLLSLNAYNVEMKWHMRTLKSLIWQILTK